MNDSLLITDAQIVTPNGGLDGWLLVRDGLIHSFGAANPPNADRLMNAEGLLLLPGFIDLHVHGAAGCEAMDADVQSLATMAQVYAHHGVTGFLATTWAAPQVHILDALRAMVDYQKQQTRRASAPVGAQLLGAHLEGPYLNRDYCGAQAAEHIRRAAAGETQRLFDLGVIRLVTLAPEFPENIALMAECLARGIRVAAGHTGATYAQMQLAVAAGLSQVTHTYNAMRGLHHREPGSLGAALDFPQILCEVIADGIHVHPAALRLLLRAKGVAGIVLITDGVRGVGLPTGAHYLQDGRTVTVKDGAAYLEDGTLAGSTLTMNRALVNFAESVGQSIETLWQTTSLNAARALGLDDHQGSIAIGKHADLTLMDSAGKVYCTLINGQLVADVFSH